jgi:hypothetical protein
MQHYSMQPSWNNTGVAHENGDVEQSHHRFKEAVDQALRARWTRDFSSRAAYERFLQELVAPSGVSHGYCVLRDCPRTKLFALSISSSSRQNCNFRLTVSKGEAFSLPARMSFW